MKNVVVLGSSGSIGESTLRVVDALPGSFRIVGLAVNRSWERVLEQAACHGVQHVAVADEEAAGQCRARAPAGVTVHTGDAGVAELAAFEEADVVVCALVGMAGLAPVMAAAGRGTDIALATKEVLVAAGEIVTAACERNGARLLPVDSEHSAIFQCMAGRGCAPGHCPTDSSDSHEDVARIILTASGGPFAERADVDMDAVTVEEALNHPRWNMGRKVTIDSATLMNKGLEIMEARWLFNIDVADIDVVIHPESIVHSMVEFVDGSMLAQLSVPDMRFAIQYALTYPQRVTSGLPRMDLAEAGVLHFSLPNEERFPCLRLAREAENTGGTMPAVLNAANEVAVEAFLAGRIRFSGIWETVSEVMETHDVESMPDLECVMAADYWARMEATRVVGE